MSEAVDYRALLAKAGYVADDILATALGMAERLNRPLLLEGEAGVGKTFVARALAAATERRLIRLQCYEGLDAGHALYEWNYQRQILEIARSKEPGADIRDDALFSERFLLKRPLLEAITQPVAPVLLIDEIDRADEEFEAFLLEILGDAQVTIPELGTITAVTWPTVILTSNGTRDLSDALRRRCLFHYMGFPDPATEVRILQARAGDISVKLAGQIARFMQSLRKQDLRKSPGIAETLDWASALMGLDIEDLGDDVESVHATLLCVLKTREDQAAIPKEVLERLVGQST